MEQHPIPQHISSYQFRLIGEMTLEQFGKLAGGCIIALVFYALPLPGLIKWFFIILSASSGALFAFVPLEGRPIETWIMSFIKSIYSPTEFVWQKSVFDFSFISPNHNQTERGIIPQTKETTRSLSVKELALLQALSESQSFYDQDEIDQAEKLLRLFGQGPLTRGNIAILPPQPAKPRKNVQFSPDLPFPSAPDQPNILVGMVIDKGGKIVEGAIIEIEDGNGDTVRAMRTNKLGQFRTVSPLPDGQYQINTEKGGLSFDIMRIQLTGEIVPPIEIRENDQESVN